MPTSTISVKNVDGLRAAIDEARGRATRNNRFGHALVAASALSAIGVALLAYASADNSPLGVLKPLLIVLATVPSAISIAEKALRPAAWEAWYARKALALEAIWRQAHRLAPDSGDTVARLSDVQIDWWNRVDEVFEKSRPSWGSRDASDLEIAKERSDVLA